MTCTIEISNRTTYSDLNLLNQLQKHLEGIGTIHIDQTRNRVNYSIDSAKELNKLFVH